MRCSLAVLALLGGCIDAALVPCGDRLCPVGYSCIADRCASPAEITACDGLADGTTCTAPSGVGQCMNGTCVVYVCGNGIVEGDEACDDGNTVSGDGCRGDCHICGDGIVDQVEGCDDGNTNPADGCDNCVLTT